jgi:hypothetical protein
MSKDNSLFQTFLKDTGYKPDELKYRTKPGRDEPARDIELFFENTKTGNIHIPYLDINGRPVKYENGTGKLRDFERIRFLNPDEKKGKYNQPPKSGSHLYFPPLTIEIKSQKNKADLVFLTEGEKKALAGSKKLGLPFVGLPGIFGLKEGDEINKDLRELIEVCRTKILVLILDSDALECKYDTNEPGKDLYKRASLFFRSVTIIKELIFPLNVDLYVSVILPRLPENPKGLDDLINAYDPEKIKKELTDLSSGTKELTVWHNVTGQSDNQLKNFFGLNDAETFYRIHKDELKQYPFTMKRLKYQHNGEKLELLKDNNNNVWWKAEKDRDGVTKGCKIVYRKFISFLQDKGFRRYDLNPETFTFIQVDDNLVSELSETKIQDYVKNYIDSLPDGMLPNDITKEDLAEKIYQSPQIYFSKPKLSLLDNSPIELQRDSLTHSYAYFSNGFVQITKAGYELKNYNELENCIYGNQVQPKKFKKASEDGNFKKFVQNIAGYSKFPERFLALRTMLGYLMHDFYDYKLRAINFTDSKLSDDDEGRTGKTLLARATQFIRNYLEVPGKTFDPTKQNKYQHAQLTTQIVHLNDAQRSFKTEFVYNDITEGIEVDKKYDKPYFIRTKYIISSNKTLQVWGASARDRFVEFELADHYSDTHTPEDEFGQWFFRDPDWDENEWNAFYNFMVECIRLFLEHGILQADTINLEERKLINETNQDFVEFIDSRIKDVYIAQGPMDASENIVLGMYFNKKILHNQFLDEFEEYKNDRYISKQKTFTNWLKRYAKYKNLDFEERRSDSNREMKFTSK